MNITPGLLYWLTRLDPLRESMIWLIIMLAAAAVMVGICTLFFSDPSTSCGEEDRKKSKVLAVKCVRLSVSFAVLFLVSIFVRSLIPTTKEAAVIYCVPAIANSEFVSETLPSEAKELFSLAKDWLKAAVGPEK